jgi:hypothetical protein
MTSRREPGCAPASMIEQRPRNQPAELTRGFDNKDHAVSFGFVVFPRRRRE